MKMYDFTYLPPILFFGHTGGGPFSGHSHKKIENLYFLLFDQIWYEVYAEFYADSKSENSL